jgi:glycosyltransferase involved in cell wall biosynthesis
MVKESIRTLTIGVDATNLRRGGGRTHLIELLQAADPRVHGINKIIIWAAQETLDLLIDRDWLIKRSPPALNTGLLRRSFWQRFRLTREARSEQCDLLFVPGGSYAGNFHPIVTMSRNMLPFEWNELHRYGWTLTTLKLILLRWIQTRSFRRADGVVYLTNYARDAVQHVTGLLTGSVAVIPHGLNTRFSRIPTEQFNINTYSSASQYRVLYVSIVDVYKHQWQVVDAIGQLRERTGWPIILDLVGSAYPPALRRLDGAIAKWDPDHAWVKYHGEISYSQMHEMYQQANLGLFASSCENMPNILLETMAFGLPIASSDRGPMPEILQNCGVYFNPEEPKDIVKGLETLIANPKLRLKLAKAAYEKAKEYSWEKCSLETFIFLKKIADNKKFRKRSAIRNEINV